jgi:hypothetical protein
VLAGLVLAVLVLVGYLLAHRKYRGPVHPVMAQQHFDPPVDAVIIEPQSGPWKNNNAWGDKRDIAMPAEGVRTQVFDGRKIVGPPRVQSVQLARGRPQSGSNSDFRAFIEYGVGALNGDFVCDWADGVQFTIVANWVRVTAITYRPNPINPYDPATGLINIGAGVAEGTVTKGREATFTESQLILGAGAAGVFESPKLARAVLLWGGNPTQVVDFIGAGSLNPFTGTIASFVTYRDFGMIFPGGAERVVVAADPASDQTVTVQWFLGL